MNPDPRQPRPTPPPPLATDLQGTRIDVGLANDQRLSLRLPHGHSLGGGTCDCKAPTVKLTAGRCKLLRERVFSTMEELLGCLFGDAEGQQLEEVRPAGEHLADEINVDLDDGLDLPVPAPDPSDTIPEGMEYLGSYRSIPAYLRAMLEPEVTPACAWILDHLDYLAVRRRWESNGSRLMIERGHVYRLADDLVAGIAPVESPEVIIQPK